MLEGTRIAARYWIYLAIPVAALLLIGITDWRYAVVALAIIFVVLPAVAMFSWFAIASRPDAVADMHPHAIMLNSDDTVNVTYPDPTSIGHPETIETPAATLSRNNIVLTYSDPNNKRRRLIIPLQAFATMAEAAEFCRRTGVSQ